MSQWSIKELTDYLEGFSKFVLELWLKVNDSQRINRLDDSYKIYTMKLDRKSTNQNKAIAAIDLQRDNFENISINEVKIPVLISSDGYVVISFIDYIDQEDEKKDQVVYLAFKVITNDHSYKLEITGLDYTYNNNYQKHEYRLGCKAKYLVKFLEQNVIAIPGNWRKNTSITDDLKTDKFNRGFVNSQIIQGQRIFEKEEALNGQNAYFKFYLKLVNEVKIKQDIEANIQFYLNAVTDYDPTQRQPERELIFINDALPVGSPYYMERRLIDERCLSAIKEPASFIRIKGSRKTGKTSLLYRIIENGVNEEYSTIFIDFAGVESEIINNFKDLCVWLCQQVTEQLEQEDITNNYFSDSPSCMRATTRYFSEHILTLEQPILLAMDNVDKVFENSDIATPLCNMLANWHRQSRVPNAMGIRWAKLRIVLAHARDAYLDWDINHSPLQGIGYVPDLLDWDSQQIKQFAKIYGIDLTQQHIQQLNGLIGGHPYLVRLAVEYLYDNQGSNIEPLLQIASTSASPFNDYLLQILAYLRKYPQCANAFRQILEMNEIQVDDQFELDKIEFKLKSLDLIRIDQNQENHNFYPKYNLYSHFFRRYLINEQPV